MARTGTIHESYAREEDEWHLCKVALHLSRDFHISPDFAQCTLEQEWSVDEDKLLINCELQHDGDWLKEYRHARRDNPKLFSKQSLASDAFLRARHAELRSSCPARYRLLHADVEAHVDAGAAAKRARDHAKEFARRLHQLVPQVRRDVVLHWESRSGSKGKVSSSREVIMAASPHLREQLLRARCDGQGKYHVIISERDPVFDSLLKPGGPGSFGAFEQGTWQCFCDACDLAEMRRQRDEAADALGKEQAEQNRQYEAFTKDLHERRDDYLRRIGEMQGSEEEALTQVCLRCAAADARLIEGMHRAHLNAELARMRRRYRLRRDEIEGFFEAEERKLESLRNKYQSATDRIQQLTAQVGVLQERIARAFPDQKLGGLLVLSEVLQADEIRQRAVSTMCSRPADFLCVPELASPLVRSATLQQILAACPWQAVAAAERDITIPKAILSKERQQRRAAAMEELRALSSQELSRLADDSSFCFPDLVNAELAARCRGDAATDAVSLVPTPASRHVLSIDRSGLTCTVIKPHRYATVIATHGRFAGVGWGKWYWEVCIEDFDKRQGGSISIGWESVGTTLPGQSGPPEPQAPAPGAAAQQQPGNDGGAQAAVGAAPVQITPLRGVQGIPGLCPGADGQYGVAWTSDGMLHLAGTSEDVGETFGAGDIVGASLDQDNCLLAFYKNGQPVPLLRGQSETRERVAHLPLPNPANYHYAPAIALYSANPRQRLRLSADFIGPFSRRLPRLHAPYAQTMQHAA
eukprot:TRINITY_DN9211_c0_g1_i2.p1 TRINITY_DN9211_c0_g1~~TRINITY_DN9211_c0_g1_i2.p1  ORF type:complete len:780 (+),score=210.12 TRINITY_DN9211_c0_g1_i2:77-2341(+)